MQWSFVDPKDQNRESKDEAMQGSRMLWQFKMKNFLQTCNVEVSRALLST